MNFLALVTLILSICACCFAAESSGYYKDSAHPGKCVVNNQVVSAGEEVRMTDECARIICGGESFATIQSCGVMGTDPSCKLGDYIDSDAPYPDCCERRIVCN